MREILFRGKRTDNGEWVYGAFSEYDVEQSGQEMFTVHNPCIIDYGNELLWTEVVPETVGQYTGMTDKNGKKIFEGDFVSSGYERLTWLIVYDDGGFSLVIDGASCNCQDFNTAYCEVVGNVYDHPELLEE